MLLEFEQPIIELEGKLAEMKQLAESSRVDVTEDVKSLERKILRLKEETYKNLTRWQRVQLSRHPERPYTLDYFYNITDDFVELHGDRTVKDDKAMVGGFGTIGGQTVMLVGQQKGRNTKQRQMRNFGMANPEGYRKAIRLMDLADKFGLPVITLVDTPGAYPGKGAEERGQSEAIARSTEKCLQIGVPIISLIIGEGGSGGAVAFATANKVIMLEHSIYSVISPEGCASILWKDAEKMREAAEALRLTAQDLTKLGVNDLIIEEPTGGAHRDRKMIFEEVKNAISKALLDLAKKKREDLIKHRRDKFLSLGQQGLAS